MRDCAVEPAELRARTGTKQAVHFGVGGRTLFGFLHLPAEGVVRNAGVVLCAPIGTDHTRSHRTYRHLAERLAAAGFACLRFDLYGTGDSGGDEFVTDLARGWPGDLGAAVDELRRRSGVAAIAVIGLRFGAAVAMTCAAERGDVDALVLWNPCVSGASFVGEVAKLHQIYVRIEPQLAFAPAAPLDGEEALGSFLPRSLVTQLNEFDLLQTKRRPAARALVIDGGNVVGRDSLVERLKDLGTVPELRTHPGHKFLVTVCHRSLVPEDVIDSIVGWLSSAYTTAGAPRRVPVMPSPPGPSGERAMVFGQNHPLFGILTPADPARARPGRPHIVMSNAGCVNRSGPHRLYTKMARRWAKLGYDVLRIDLSGIGDSPAVLNERENVNYPVTGLDDIRAATRTFGAGPVIVAGLCSGGDYAFQLGASEAGVTGAWLMNPRTFCVLELAAVEAGSPPATSVDEVPRTLREMADRGVDTLLVVSKNDPGVAYLDARATDAMRSLEGARGFQRLDLEGADHSFTPMAVQQRVSDALTEHLGALDARDR